MSSDVLFLLFKNIQNLAQIKQMMTNNTLQAAVVSPVHIFHPDQLLFAAHKSMYSDQNHQLKTKTIFTEVIYNLSPNKSIRDALKTFGFQEGVWSNRAVFVTFSREHSEELLEIVDGKPLDLDDISEVNDVSSIRKLYKIPDNMTEDDDILNCILTRMATKDLL